MPVTSGMFGAPVYLPDAPNILGPAIKFRELAQRDRALDIDEQQQASLQANRQTLSGFRQKQELTARLGALIHLSGDNPEMATKFLDQDTELQQMFNVKPGQYEFQGKKGRDIVVYDRQGGRSFLVDPTARDPATAVREGPPLTPTPLTKGQIEAEDYAAIPEGERVAAMRAKVANSGKSVRARTRAEIAASAAGGNKEDAALFAQTGGLSGYMHSLLRRGAGGNVIDPDVQAMDPKVARHEAAKLGKVNGMNAILQDALSSDPAYGGGGAMDGGGDAAAGAGDGDAGAVAPAAAPAGGDGYIRFRNAAGQVIRTKDPNLAPPPGFEPMQ